MQRLNYIERKIKQFWFWYAKQLADSYHLADGKRYVVVPYGDRFIVMNNTDRKIINRSHRKHNRMDINWLLKRASYYTK